VNRVRRRRRVRGRREAATTATAGEAPTPVAKVATSKRTPKKSSRGGSRSRRRAKSPGESSQPFQAQARGTKTNGKRRRLESPERPTSGKRVRQEAAGGASAPSDRSERSPSQKRKLAQKIRAQGEQQSRKEPIAEVQATEEQVEKQQMQERVEGLTATLLAKETSLTRQRHKLEIQAKELKRQRKEMADLVQENADNLKLLANVRALLGAAPMAAGCVPLAPAPPALAAPVPPSTLAAPLETVATSAPTPPPAALAAPAPSERPSDRYVPGVDRCPQDTEDAEKLAEVGATPTKDFFYKVYANVQEHMCDMSGKHPKFELTILNHKLKVSYVNRPDKVTGKPIRDRKKFVLHRPLPSGAHEGDTHAIKAWASVVSYFGE